MRLKLQIAAFILVIVAISVVFMIPAEDTVGIKTQVRESLAPAFKWFSGIPSRADLLGEKLKRAERLERENEDLRKANARFQAENNTLRSFEKENTELRQALKYKEVSRFELVPARVIAREPSTWWQYVTIDRGQRDGVELSQAVVTTQGLVGKIASVSATTSKVVLLGDENCRVAATLEGTNEQGIIIGQPTEMGAVQCRMTFISRTASIDVGQLAFTSGLGGVFPRGCGSARSHNWCRCATRAATASTAKSSSSPAPISPNWISFSSSCARRRPSPIQRPRPPRLASSKIQACTGSGVIWTS
jgi:rod shape-determining protein MreC